MKRVDVDFPLPRPIEDFPVRVVTLPASEKRIPFDFSKLKPMLLLFELERIQKEVEEIQANRYALDRESLVERERRIPAERGDDE